MYRTWVCVGVLLQLCCTPIDERTTLAVRFTSSMDSIPIGGPVCPSVCPFVCPSVCMSLRMSPYVCSSVCLTSRYVCSFLVTFLYISPCLSVSLCAPLWAPRVSVRAGVAGVVFWPKVSISLMQLGLGRKRTVGAAAVRGPFWPDPSTCFIDPAYQFGSGANVCGIGSCKCAFPA